MYPTIQQYQGVLADVATYTGAVTLASMVGSRLVFQYLGWGVAASTTPLMMGVAGAVFFGATLLAGSPAVGSHAATLAAVGAVAGVVTQVWWPHIWVMNESTYQPSDHFISPVVGWSGCLWRHTWRENAAEPRDGCHACMPPERQHSL